MTDKPEYLYTHLDYEVNPLLMVGHVKQFLIGKLPQPDLAIKRTLEDVGKLYDDYPIPVKFHLTINELHGNVFRYDILVTYKKGEHLPSWYDLLVMWADGTLCRWEPYQEVTVCWRLFCDQPLSTHRINWLIEFASEMYPPLDYTTYVSHKLVGVWKGVGIY